MNDTEYKPLTIGNWLITFILLAIPIVNFIMLIVWACNSETQPSKRNFAKAYLIIFGAIVVIAIAAALILPLIAHFAK